MLAGPQVPRSRHLPALRGQLTKPLHTRAVPGPLHATELEGIERMAGSHVAAMVTPTGGVTVSAAEAPAGGGGAAGGRGGAAPRMQLERPKAAGPGSGGAWVSCCAQG